MNTSIPPSRREVPVIALTTEGKRAIKEVLRHLQRAEAAFTRLGGTDNHACFDLHGEGTSLNHCLRWGLQAAEEVNAAMSARPVAKRPL